MSRNEAQGRAVSPARWVPPQGRKPRILLVRLSALGDVLHALPVLAALKALHADAEVDWAVEDRCAGVLEGRPDIGRLVVLPRRALRSPARAPARFVRTVRAFLRDLRSRDYDLVLDLQGNLKSGLVTRAARSPVRFGLDRRAAREGNHLFTTRRALPPPTARHRVERNLALLAAALGRDVPYAAPPMPTADPVRREVDAALAAAGVPARGFAVLHPGTSGFGEFKRWPAPRFGALARALAAQGRRVVVTAGPGEEALAAGVARASDGAATVLSSPSLPFLTEVLRRASLFVSADTGPLHLASLLGTPLLGLFGPKDPAVYGPYGRRADGTVGLLPVLARDDVACRPCGLRRCADPVCMRGMEPDDVARAVSPRAS